MVSSISTALAIYFVLWWIVLFADAAVRRAQPSGRQGEACRAPIPARR